MINRIALFCLSLVVIPVNAEETPESFTTDAPSSEFAAVLENLETQYGETAASIKALHADIEQLRVGLAQIRTNIHYYQTEIDKENKELANQVKAAYLIGQQEQLKLMLNQQDPALSSRMLIYYQYINKDRLARLTAIEKKLAQLNELEQQKQQQTEQLQERAEQKQNQQTLLNQYRKRRNELLAQLNNDEASDVQRINEIKNAETQLKSLLESLKNNETVTVPPIEQTTESDSSEDDAQPSDLSTSVRFTQLKGRLKWPTQGKITSSLENPTTNATHKDVIISANEGIDVKAIAPGKVVFSGPMQRYGLLIIIEHGDGYLSLYGHNQSLYKQKNDLVKTGEVIAAVGQSGGQNRTGLFFGIRKQDSPLDPREWCR